MIVHRGGGASATPDDDRDADAYVEWMRLARDQRRHPLRPLALGGEGGGDGPHHLSARSLQLAATRSVVIASRERLSDERLHGLAAFVRDVAHFATLHFRAIGR